MILYCVRHGESTYNAEGRVQGQSDVPLSELGLRQADAVAAALAEAPFEAIYSSPLQRAYRVAEIVAERHRLEIRTDDRLKEVHAGIFQDKLRSDLAKLHPKELARWTSGDLHFKIPGGESRLELQQRGAEVLREIADRHEGHVAVISHGRLLITALKALLEIPLDESPRSLRNASISRIQHNGDGRFLPLALDEIEHLADLGIPGQGDL